MYIVLNFWNVSFTLLILFTIYSIYNIFTHEDGGGYLDFSIMFKLIFFVPLNLSLWFVMLLTYFFGR